MSWYDPFKLKRRKWSERSPTGKKIYVIYYLILVSVLGVILWIGEFSEEAQNRDQQKMLEWQDSRRKEALEENKIHLYYNILSLRRYILVKDIIIINDNRL